MGFIVFYKKAETQTQNVHQRRAEAVFFFSFLTSESVSNVIKKSLTFSRSVYLPPSHHVEAEQRPTRLNHSNTSVTSLQFLWTLECTVSTAGPPDANTRLCLSPSPSVCCGDPLTANGRSVLQSDCIYFVPPPGFQLCKLGD